MKHADVKQNLADYLEGDLPLELRASIDAHLDGCAECAREVDEMQQTVRLLRTLPDPETPPMIAANVMRRIRAGETEPGFLVRIGRSIAGVLEPSFVLPASAIAAAALVFMVVQDPGALARFAPDSLADLSGSPRWSDASEGTAAQGGPPSAPLASELASIELELPLSLSAAPSAPEARPTAGLVPDRVSASGSSTAGSESGVLTYRFQFEVPESFAAARRPETRVPASSPRRAELGATLAQRGGGDSLVPASEVGRARRVAQPLRGSARSLARESSGGEDPRDQWLARGLENPVGLARFLAEKNIAEHELWVARLAERAVERGLLDDLVAALRSSGDASAAILSDDFLAQAMPTGDADDPRTDDRHGGEPFRR